MKDVQIELVNIQSHEHTVFSLHPGLNFILAEDNNVGKSTIFQVLMCAMELPQVPHEEISQLIRSRTMQARATFRFDTTICTLWLFRGDGSSPRAFFETDIGDGVVTRSMSAPASLREALDVITGADGKVVNFNDADSVQLIVQDTPKNDEVLAQVLVDVKVDNIKANSVRLRHQMQQDYIIAKSHYDDTTTILSTMRYVHEVDSFNDEEEVLAVACRVADSVCDVIDSVDYGGRIVGGAELHVTRKALDLYNILDGIDIPAEPATEAISDDIIDTLDTGIGTLNKLLSGLQECDVKVLNIQAAQITKARQGISVLERLQSACVSAGFAQSAARDMHRLSSEKDSVLSKLGQITQRVRCPIKGEVFYSDDKCISCSDRLAL